MTVYSINQSIINLYSAEAQNVSNAPKRRVNTGKQKSFKNFHDIAIEDISGESRISEVVRWSIPNSGTREREYHRLNGSSSPVLTATCLSYGSFCDFLTFFFPEHAWGSDAQPIFTQNGSNDVDSRIDVPFAVKMETF